MLVLSETRQLISQRALRACQEIIDLLADARRRVNGVVPVAVKAMPLQADGSHLHVGDGDTGRVLAAVEFGAHAQSRPALRRADQTYDVMLVAQ